MSHPLVIDRRMKEFNVYIGRGSPWGNPFTHLRLGNTKAMVQVATRAESIERYGAWLRQQPDLLKRLHELTGKRLGCYCAPLDCHGDLLARLANDPAYFEVWVLEEK